MADIAFFKVEGRDVQVSQYQLKALLRIKIIVNNLQFTYAMSLPFL